MNNVTINSLERQLYSRLYPKSLRIITSTSDAPPTQFDLLKNYIAQSHVNKTIEIIDRRNSNFRTTLLLKGNPLDLIGNYTLVVGNSQGRTSKSLPQINGEQY